MNERKLPRTHLTFDGKTAYCNAVGRPDAIRVPLLAHFSEFKDLTTQCGSCKKRFDESKAAEKIGRYIDAQARIRARDQRKKKKPSVAPWIIRDGQSLSEAEKEIQDFMTPLNKQLIYGTASITFDELNGQLVAKLRYRDNDGEYKYLKYLIKKNAYSRIGQMLKEAQRRLRLPGPLA